MDNLEFRLINPYEKGEPWAQEYGDGDDYAIEIYINGEELLDIAAKVEHPDEPGKKQTEYGHIGPHELYFELYCAPDKRCEQRKDGAALTCCGDCGCTHCYSIYTTVRVFKNKVRWAVRGRKFGETRLVYNFPKDEYLTAMRNLKNIADSLPRCNIHDAYPQMTLFRDATNYLMIGVHLREFLWFRGFTDDEILESGLTDPETGESLLSADDIIVNLTDDSGFITGLAVISGDGQIKYYGKGSGEYQGKTLKA